MPQFLFLGSRLHRGREVSGVVWALAVALHGVGWGLDTGVGAHWGCTWLWQRGSWGRPPVHEVEGRAGSGLTQPVLWDGRSRRGLSVDGMPLKPLSLGPPAY